MKQLCEAVGKGSLICAQVCLRKEQENRVTMELQMSSLEEQLEKVTSDLSAAQADRESLKAELTRHQTENEVITMLVYSLFYIFLCRSSVHTVHALAY